MLSGYFTRGWKIFGDKTPAATVPPIDEPMIEDEVPLGIIREELVPAEQDGAAETPFDIDKLPEELLQLVFQKLDIKSLKACRSVCTEWNRLSRNTFLKRSCLSFQRILFETDETAEEKAAQFRTHGLPLNHDSVRLSQMLFVRSQLPPGLYKWFNPSTMSGIASFELCQSHLKLQQFLQLISAFQELHTLILSRDTSVEAIPPLVGQTEPPEWLGVYLNFARPILGTVRILRLYSFHAIAFLTGLEAVKALCFERLTEFDLREKCVLSTIDRIPASSGAVATILAKNIRTLKILKLGRLPKYLRQGLDVCLASEEHLTRKHLGLQFPIFLKEIQQRGWTEMGLDLDELRLQLFPVANMAHPLVNQVLVPFLAAMTNLRRIAFSFAYFSNETVEVERFLAVFPADCTVSLDSTHVFVHNLDPTDLDGLLCSQENILKYAEASIELHFRTVRWKIHYLTWNTLMGQPVLQMYAGVLTKLVIMRVCFRVTDQDIQFLISVTPKLRDLRFQTCDLSRVTDFGLTGLTPRALNRVRVHRLRGGHYEPVLADFVGLPLSHLKDLASLTLTTLGQGVTDLSVIMGFTLVARLTNLVIHQETASLTEELLESMGRAKIAYVKYTVSPTNL